MNLFNQRNLYDKWDDHLLDLGRPGTTERKMEQHLAGFLACRINLIFVILPRKLTWTLKIPLGRVIAVPSIFISIQIISDSDFFISDSNLFLAIPITVIGSSLCLQILRRPF